MMKALTTCFLLVVSTYIFSQNNISGKLTDLSNQDIELIGYNGFDTYTIDKVKINKNGKFSLNYKQADFGAAYLLSEINNSFIVILNGETFKLKGRNLDYNQVIKGKSNKLFDQYAIEEPRRNKTLAAWKYLENIYDKDPLFSKKQKSKKYIKSEINYIEAQDSLFLSSLPKNSYIAYYLPLRKLIFSVQSLVKQNTSSIPKAIKAFRNIDYTDPKLYKSGLLKQSIESHFWLIENSGIPLEAVNTEMKTSIDFLVNNLLADEKKLNKIGDELFKLLESRSLFEVSEYLALKLLNNSSCTIESNFASKLESYRAMKIGNIAPDIVFSGDVLSPNYTKQLQKLSDLTNKYTIVIFGSSWCAHCPNELAKIYTLYNKWKTHDIEVIFISLDENEKTFNNFSKIFPFISVCDYYKWESQMVKDYHVFGTPSIFVLDNKREILLRPNSVKHLNSWIDWYVIKDNK